MVYNEQTAAFVNSRTSPYIARCENESKSMFLDRCARDIIKIVFQCLYNDMERWQSRKPFIEYVMLPGRHATEWWVLVQVLCRIRPGKSIWFPFTKHVERRRRHSLTADVSPYDSMKRLFDGRSFERVNNDDVQYTSYDVMLKRCS